MDLLRRPSLAAQAAEILRTAIRRGEWTGYLPGEHALSERLKVSRTTLRTALRMLRREGLIEVSQGRRMRIPSRPRRPSAVTEAKVVGIVAGLPYHELSSFSLFLISRLQDDLSDLGCRLEVHADPRFASRHPARSLTHLTNSVRTDAWVLLSPAPECLQWFTKRNLRAISVGGTPENRCAPAVDVDSAAAVRHAVGLFLKRGYSRVVLWRYDREVTGQASLEKAFTEAFAAGAPGASAQSIVVRHAPGVAGIQKAVDPLLTSPGSPTGILVMATRDVGTLICHLANARIRVPQQVGLISLGHLPHMDGLLPSVAHYTFNWKRFAKRLSDAIRTLLTVGELPQKQISILPEFREADSLAAVP